MDKEMQRYYDYTVSPLGEVFYQTVWKQLDFLQGQKILDFGSGFAFTANALAKQNSVVAVEMNAAMIAAAQKKENFEQIHGDLSVLQTFPKESFDVVLCHMVFEFVDNAKEILFELLRVLKKGGVLSIVRHNRAGRIVQAVVQEADFNEVHKLMQGGHAYSSAFGHIKYYENEDLLYWLEDKAQIESVQGVRALASLHDAAVQGRDQWVQNMLEVEWALLQNPAFVSIAYFNHVLLRKNV